MKKEGDSSLERRAEGDTEEGDMVDINSFPFI
jgi:hypothetical protein